MKKENNENKKIIIKSSVYFAIFNLVVAIIAFSYGISIVSAAGSTLLGCGPTPLDPGLAAHQAKLASQAAAGFGHTITPGASASTGALSTGASLRQFFGKAFQSGLFYYVAVGMVVGGLIDGKEGVKWGGFAGTGGWVAHTLTTKLLATSLANAAPGTFLANYGALIAPGVGLAVAVGLYLLLRAKDTKEIEFKCKPYEAPMGGEDCEKCNEFEYCSEYTCKSLGQACEIINEGEEDRMCIWKNPRDVNSPIITFREVKDHIFKEDISIRPPATGVVISQSNEECVEAYTAIEFTFDTQEPAQCKVDNNITRGYEEMSYYVGDTNIYDYNHTQVLALPGPDAINSVAPELKNDGIYNMYVRCQDANGNFNQDVFSVKFCVKKGPDTTPPVIDSVSVISGSPVQFNRTELDLEVYVNEPSECKWGRTDTSYDNMEESFDCETNLFKMNNKNLYTCSGTLTGVEDRKENKYYIRCKDQPFEEEGNRNVNSQSYLYTIIGTQPLNILSFEPSDEIIKGATDTIPVFLEVATDNGFNKGESICYYSMDEDTYVEFFETRSNEHVQRQDLITGDYTYFIKCVDPGGNTVYNQTSFSVESDKSAPIVVRVYKQGGDLKLITDDGALCTYSNNDCNFEIDSGIKMDSFDGEIHTSEWVLNKNYYIRCQDKYENQPNPNSCSIIIKPSDLTSEGDVIVL
jgi:hypothetical protein